jgi:hypothetical protein
MDHAREPLAKTNSSRDDVARARSNRGTPVSATLWRFPLAMIWPKFTVRGDLATTQGFRPKVPNAMNGSCPGELVG